MTENLRVFKVRISYNDNEGWVTLNPIVYAFHKSEVEYIIINRYPHLPLFYDIKIEEVFPTRGTVL